MILVHLYSFSLLIIFIFSSLSCRTLISCLLRFQSGVSCFHDPLRKIFRLYSQIDFRPLFPFHRFLFYRQNFFHLLSRLHFEKVRKADPMVRVSFLQGVKRTVFFHAIEAMQPAGTVAAVFLSYLSPVIPSLTCTRPQGSSLRSASTSSISFPVMQAKAPLCPHLHSGHLFRVRPALSLYPFHTFG